MKRYLVWFSLMMKRMLKKPAFVLLLLVMPLITVLMARLEKDESTGNVVGVMIETGAEEAGRQETEEVSAGEPAEPDVAGDQKDTWDRQLLTLLTEPEGQKESIFTFRPYESRERLIRDVENGELTCGLVLPGDLEKRFRTDTWQESIVVYETASANMTAIVKERVASTLFSIYSEESYVNYIRDTEAFRQTEKRANGGDMAIEEVVSFAQEAYASHLIDDSTFAFAYHGDDLNGQSKEGALITSTFHLTFHLRGILAVCIFLSGLCGLLTDWEDRRKKRFVRMIPAQVTTAVNVWIPTIYTSVMAFVCLVVSGESAAPDGGYWQVQSAGAGAEVLHLLFYQFLIVCYCSIIRLLLRKQETIAAAVPIFTAASLVCCPVFIRLAVYVPFFRILEKLFPVTYYLLL
ncbi:MAG: hypothetical protein NC434_14115 [Ruminococcus sp.]|nr:hypothetical protein [Ruminococcus sp.]